MNECQMVIDYYDLLFQRRANYDNKSFPLAIQHKLDNMLQQYVLSDPNGISEFISKVHPDSHKIVGFNKPWKWFRTYKDYPDIFEYLIGTYYTSECAYVKSKKTPHKNASNIVFPFTNPYTNKFISIYNYNELQDVKALAKFILAEKLDVDYRLITSVMYLLVLNGSPKIGLELCEYLKDRDNDNVGINKDTSLQNRLYHLAKEALNYDVYEALDTWYLPDLLSRNTVFDMTPNENNMKSFRMFLDMIAQKNGYSASSFVGELNEKQFIQLYKKTKDCLDVATMKLHPVYTFYLSRLQKLDLLDESTSRKVKDEYKTIRSGVLNNRLISCQSDRDFFEKVNQMDVKDMEEFDRKLLNAYRLIIG